MARVAPDTGISIPITGTLIFIGKSWTACLIYKFVKWSLKHTNRLHITFLGLTVMVTSITSTTDIEINRNSVIFLRWTSQTEKFKGTTWGPPGSCWPQMGPMLVPWTLLSMLIGPKRPAFSSVNIFWYSSRVHQRKRIVMLCIVQYYHLWCFNWIPVLTRRKPMASNLETLDFQNKNRMGINSP